MEIFKTAPMSDKDIQLMTEQCNRAYNHWLGVFLHIADKSRWNLSYVSMSLSEYNNCQSIIFYNILYQGMCYLYHHPHILIMYPAKEDNTKQHVFHSQFGYGEAEYKSMQKIPKTFMEVWGDADLEREIMDHQSTSSSLHKWGEVAFTSQCVKLPEVAASTRDAEVRALFQTTKRTLLCRDVIASLGVPQQYPTPEYEDNALTIAHVIKDRLTPRVKHMGTLIGWLNEQFLRERMNPVSCTSEIQEAGMNTKPHGVFQLQLTYLSIVGYQFYPPPSSEHYKLTEVDKYNTDAHSGSFLPNQSSDNQELKNEEHICVKHG